VLKLGHHGSRTSSSVEYLQTVKPKLAIISAGLKNQYGHPHKEVLDRLNNMHIPYLETSKNGTINCKSNGQVVECK
ncbi:MAG: ComEC/Rec2 family competence protein, partial [Minisyncoccia bacterium]